MGLFTKEELQFIIDALEYEHNDTSKKIVEKARALIALLEAL